MLMRKLIQWVHDKIVGTLAHNKSFQRFALNMDEKISKKKDVLNKVEPDKIAEVVVQSAKNVDLNQKFTSAVEFMKKVHKNVK